VTQEEREVDESTEPVTSRDTAIDAMAKTAKALRVQVQS
jgi:hypothetical protein